MELIYRVLIKSLPVVTLVAFVLFYSYYDVAIGYWAQNNGFDEVDVGDQAGGFTTVVSNDGSANIPKPKGPQKLLLLKLNGGLGNHLWEYSALYSLAKLTHRTPVACVQYNFKVLFDNISVPLNGYGHCDSILNRMARSIVVVNQTDNSVGFDPSVLVNLKKNSGSNVITYGYFQNLKYFAGFEDSLKAQFVIKKEHSERAQRYLYTLTQRIATNAKSTLTSNEKGQLLLDGKLPIFVIIHVRRGDMLHVSYTYPPDKGYFTRALDFYRRKYGKSVVFIVASMDTRWCKTNIKGPDVYYSADTGSKSREIDFSIGVNCNHTITSIGTYGWWMGYLSGGDVVYYKNWVRGYQKEAYVQSQYFPKHWIPMT